MSATRTFLLALAVTTLPSTGPVEAQIRASEPGSFTQTIDGTVFAMGYYRPRARGRAPLFGKGSVVWEETWTPGANWATWIEFQKPIKLDGVPLEAGKYAIWMHMAEADFMPDELILEPYVRRFHTQPPEPADNQIRMPLTVTEGPHRELLTWEFEDIASTGGTLALRWGTARIAFDIRVEPSMRQTVTEEEASPIVGMYTLRFVIPDGQESPEATFEIQVMDDQTLQGDIEGMNTGAPDDAFFNAINMRLLPVAEAVFAPGEVYDGELREVWENAFAEFTVEDGVATSFVFRDENDTVFMKGSRRR